MIELHLSETSGLSGKRTRTARLTDRDANDCAIPPPPKQQGNLGQVHLGLRGFSSFCFSIFCHIGNKHKAKRALLGSCQVHADCKLCHGSPLILATACSCLKMKHLQGQVLWWLNSGAHTVLKYSCTDVNFSIPNGKKSFTLRFLGNIHVNANMCYTAFTIGSRLHATKIRKIDKNVYASQHKIAEIIVQ